LLQRSNLGGILQVQAFFADQVPLQLPPGHRLPAQKYGLLRAAVVANLPGVRVQPAPEAPDADLLRVHAPGYVRAVVEGLLSAAELREIGFPWSPAMAERARRSVGATIAAARAACREGVAANLAGGTHHAQADKGSGYCVFNDVAVAARVMQAERGGRSALRVAVIDLDVHQGNGTAAIFAGDPSVFTLSLHGAKNFPFRKATSDLDVDLPDGCTDDAYLDALDAALAELWARHGDRPPQLAFYLAGADPHEGDRLGRLKLTAPGLAERDRRVFAALRERAIPVAMVMAGGYGRVIEDTVAVQVASVREALASWRAWQARGVGPGAAGEAAA
jgi:acetoin utilization deacetylase AcuC-like enzyme